MSDLVDKLNSLSSPGFCGSDVKQIKTPESWRPRMEVDAEGGFLISPAKPSGNVPDSDDLLREFDLNPENWAITSVKKSKWQNNSGEWLESHRISFKPIELFEITQKNDLDLEKMIEEVSKWKPKKVEKNTSGNLAFVFAPSDQQIGKKQGDSGTEGTVARILDITEQAVERLKELRKIGRSVGTVVIALPGDHVEGNVSQGGKLQGLAASDLGLTEQTRVARRVLMAQIKVFAPLCNEIIVPVVNGNHDEVTRQVSADPSDGWNVEIASSVQDACAENENLSHVFFRFPGKSHQTLSINVCGTVLGLFHGHQAGNNVMKYLQEQSAGQTPLGMADLWLSGHYHSYKSMDVGKRFWVQAPTVDPGSAWYRDRHGVESPPGILTMVIGEDYDPRRDISILSCSKML